MKSSVFAASVEEEVAREVNIRSIKILRLSMSAKQVIPRLKAVIHSSLAIVLFQNTLSKISLMHNTVEIRDNQLSKISSESVSTTSF